MIPIKKMLLILLILLTAAVGGLIAGCFVGIVIVAIHLFFNNHAEPPNVNDKTRQN